MKKKFVYAVVILSLFLLNACQSQKGGETGTDGNKPAEISTEPVTLKFFAAQGAFRRDDFDAYFGEVKKKYPHITVEYVEANADKLQEFITAGNVPDILSAGLPGFAGLKELNIVEDLNPYIKKFRMDLSRFDPVIVESIKKFSDKGEMMAIPLRMNIPALFYNKDVFDKFGVPYPQDGMTWEETNSLARKLTRSDGGLQYLGLFTTGADRMGMGLTLPYMNKEKNAANLETDAWKQVLNQYHAIHSVPGYVKDGKVQNAFRDFLKDRLTGMSANWGADGITDIGVADKNGQVMNWDMVTIPTFEKGKGSAWQAEAHNLIVTSTSKYKDQAFQVVSLLVSDEVQKLANKRSQISVLKKTEDIKKEFGSDLAFLNGKNTNALFKLQPGVHDHTKFDGKGRGFIVEAANEMVLKGTDVNTALRNAQDKLNKYIMEQTGK